MLHVFVNDVEKSSDLHFPLYKARFAATELNCVLPLEVP